MAPQKPPQNQNAEQVKIVTIKVTTGVRTCNDDRGKFLEITMIGWYGSTSYFEKKNFVFVFADFPKAACQNCPMVEEAPAMKTVLDAFCQHDFGKNQKLL